MSHHPAADPTVPLSSGESLGRFGFTRPRFWICTGGISMVGFALGMKDLSPLFQLENFLYLILFLAAMHFFSGVNELFAESTDREYPSESGSGQRLEKIWRRQTVLPALIILPGVLGYFLAAGTLPPPLFVLAGFLHYSALHIFSAIPAIASDHQAGTTTNPPWFDLQASLKICYGCWLIFAVLAVSLAGFHPVGLLAFIYPAFPVSLLLREQMEVDTVHGYLPYVSMILGGLLFTAVIISKIPAHILTIL